MLEATGDGWWCVCCRRCSASWEVLAPQRCLGPAAAAWQAKSAADARLSGCIDAGHLLRAFGHISWCDRCGAYAEFHAKGLARVCSGRPHDAAAKGRRDLLRAGRHPRSGLPLGGVPASAEAPHAGPGSASSMGRADALPGRGPGQANPRFAALLLRVRAREAALRGFGVPMSLG